MKRKIAISLILIPLIAGSILGSNPEDIIKELRFNPIQMDYEEGLRNDLSIYNIIEDDRGVFWLGSIKGLYRFNGSSAIDMRARINNAQSNLIASSWITAVVKDDSNRIWFGTTLGAYVFDQDTDKCFKIALESEHNVTPENSHIEQISFHNESAYIGTMDGLYAVDKENLKVKNSFMTNGSKSFTGKGSDSRILSIYPDISTKELWFASKFGIHRLSTSTDIDTFSMLLDDDNIGQLPLSGIFHNGELIIADYRFGVVHFDIKSKSFQSSSIENKYKGFSALKSIIHLEDDLFLINAENLGIAVYDAASKEYDWLETSGNIKSSRYNLSKDSHGFLWFATNGQLFRSNLSFPDKTLLVPNALDIGNAFANGKRLNNILGLTKTLFLNHSENNLQINFSLTNDLVYKDLSYQYQMDKGNWIDIVEKNKLKLFDLPAGNCQLSIRAKVGDSEIAHSSITIDVHRPFTNSPLFYTLILMSFVGLGSIAYFYNKRQYEKAAQIKSKYETRLATLESQALRSQINPHFIFNTLNSIKYYSIEKSPEETSDFISSFSTLIRRILENSKKNLIPLQEEIETLRNYTDIEALRFHERFDVDYKIHPGIETERFLVPPMIIQPFIENAIWHGLMHKSGNRKLSINFMPNGLGLVCEVIDNGIGREASNALKIKDGHKSSLGMKITKERMEIINARNLTANSFTIEDLTNENGSSAGTKVSLYFLPKENN